MRKLITKLRNIHAINRVPMKLFREYMEIVKNFTYLDTPDEFIFESLKDKLNHRQIERLIEYYKGIHKTDSLRKINRDINKLFPKKVVLESNKVRDNLHSKEPVRKRQVRKAVKAFREKQEFEAWMEQHKPTTKDRKPKPKKTFWHVSPKVAKYRSKTKK